MYRLIPDFYNTCVVYAIVPCGSHQLPVFLKYSVHLKLLAQLVHK